MAKQYKKLQQKIHPQKPAARPQAKVGKDYLLLAVIAFTVIVMAVGWQHLDLVNRVMYILLTVSLSLTYVRRHAKLSEAQQIFADRASFAAIGLAVAMFLIVLYQQFFG